MQSEIAVIVAAIINAVAVVWGGVWAARIMNAKANPNVKVNIESQPKIEMQNRKPRSIDWVSLLLLSLFVGLPICFMAFSNLETPVRMIHVYLIAIFIAESSLGILLVAVIYILRKGDGVFELLTLQSTINKANTESTKRLAYIVGVLVKRIKKSALKRKPPEPYDQFWTNLLR
ncbi:MAG: hypothetical protein ABI623_09280 [bacterium]